jgi:hypothetical protein
MEIYSLFFFLGVSMVGRALVEGRVPAGNGSMWASASSAVILGFFSSSTLLHDRHLVPWLSKLGSPQSSHKGGGRPRCSCHYGVSLRSAS